MEVYIVYLDFECRGYWEERTIGIYSSEEKARKAVDSYIKSDADPSESCEWELDICKVIVDEDYKECLVYQYNSSQGEKNE